MIGRRPAEQDGWVLFHPRLVAGQPPEHGRPAPRQRLLVARHAEGSVETLLRYLPFVYDPELEEDIYYSLDELGATGGKLHPALLKALTRLDVARRHRTRG